MTQPTPKPPQPPARPDAFFLAHLDQWLIVAVDDTLPRFPEIKAHGTHATAYLYNDHEKGLALRIDSFIVLSSDGYPRVTRNVFQEDGRNFILLHQDTPEPRTYNQAPWLIARAALFPFLAIRPPTKLERVVLFLSEPPPAMEIYNPPEYAAIRQTPWLAPFRAPWYPDDLNLFLPAQTVMNQGRAITVQETIWGRAERLRDDGSLECTLLNQPNHTAAFRKGDRVLVATRDPKGDPCPFITGPAT